MKDVAELNVKQVRIFPADGLPLVRLLVPPVAPAFKERFGWLGVTPAEREVVFGSGSLPAAGEDTVVIRAVRFTERRMTLEVAGNSSEANRAYEAIAEFLEKQAGWKRCDPVVTTEESTCVATLDFNWTALVSPALRDFGLGPMVATLSQRAKAEVAGLRLAFRLRYPIVPRELLEHGVAMAEKEFNLEPRAGTPLDARRYFSVAPTDSATHLQLLGKLERALGQSRERGRKPPKGAS